MLKKLNSILLIKYIFKYNMNKKQLFNLRKYLSTKCYSKRTIYVETMLFIMV